MVIAALTCYKHLSITHLEIYPNQSSPTDFAEEPKNKASQKSSHVNEPCMLAKIPHRESLGIRLGVCRTYNFTKNQHVESSALANTVYSSRFSRILESNGFGAIYLLSW